MVWWGRKEEVEDARIVWIYSVMPDCLADRHVTGHAQFETEAMFLFGPRRGRIDSTRWNSWVLLVQLYSWRAAVCVRVEA
jgi:hypothetical protein